MAQAAVGSTLATINPSPSGNGRAVAFDPAGGHLYYTNYPDPHIYVTDTSGHLLQTLDPRIGGGGLNIMYGALSWQSTPGGGFLWGGRYDGTGGVDQIDPNTGVVTPVFTFSFPAGDSCYAQASGLIDGLAYDNSDNTLWLGDDAARVFFHVTTTGTTIGSFSTPNGLCRSGIAASSNFLWLGLQSGPDTAPYEIGRVAKSDPATLLQTIPVQDNGPEGLALDHSTFPRKCALWTNQFGNTTILTARELPQGMCGGVPVFHPVSKPSLRSVGLLTFHTFDNGHPVTRGCVATVVNSANSSTIITAAHCVAGAVAFGGNPNQQITKLEFAPAHTGACWAGIPSQTPQIDVDQCGNNPYGVFYADPHDVYIPPSYVPGASNNPDDFAFIVVRPHSDGTRVQEAVGGFDITWDNNPDPATDPLQSETWTVTSYAADDPSWLAETGVFGPYECNWIGDTNGTGPSASRIGAVLSQQCSSVDPITGSTVALQYPSDKAASFGSSGSPWTNNQNAPDGETTIGAIEAGGAFNCTAGPNNCLRYMQGTKLGTDAENVLAQAEAAFVPAV
jgi:hypothetical protein